MEHQWKHYQYSMEVSRMIQYLFWKCLGESSRNLSWTAAVCRKSDMSLVAWTLGVWACTGRETDLAGLWSSYKYSGEECLKQIQTLKDRSQRKNLENKSGILFLISHYKMWTNVVSTRRLVIENSRFSRREWSPVPNSSRKALQLWGRGGDDEEANKWTPPVCRYRLCPH